MSGRSAVHEEAHTFSTLPITVAPSARKTACLPALQAYHARERELRCVATEIVQEPGSSPDLLMQQEQYALAISNDKLRACLADQPQYFALIFSITEVPPFALLRSGSEVKDATVHIRQGVVFCQWLRLFDVAATGFPELMILTFFVSPSVNDPPFSSISAANNGLTSLRKVTQLCSAQRVVGERTDHVRDDGEFAPIPLRSSPIHRFLRHKGR